MTILQFENRDEALEAQSRIFPNPRETQLALPGYEGEFEQRPEYKLILIDGKKYWAWRVGTKLSLEYVVAERFERIMKAAGDFGENEIEFCYDGYAEPGYTDPECGIICAANWNNKTRYNRETQEHELLDDTPERVLKLLEKLGVECEWSDEWITCGDCYRMIRTQADCMDWTPSYAIVNDCDVLCHECIEKDPADHLEEQAGTDDGISIAVDMEDHGYVKFVEMDSIDWKYHKTEHVKVLWAHEIEDFVVDNNEHVIWLPVRYRGRLNALRAAVECRAQDINDYLGDLTDSLDLLELEHCRG